MCAVSTSVPLGSHSFGHRCDLSRYCGGLFCCLVDCRPLSFQRQEEDLCQLPPSRAALVFTSWAQNQAATILLCFFPLPSVGLWLQTETSSPISAHVAESNENSIYGELLFPLASLPLNWSCMMHWMELQDLACSPPPCGKTALLSANA